jgi:hypothetical protein
MHAFPNNSYDGSQRIVGMWFVGRQTHAAFAQLSYFVHAMPGRALPRPRVVLALPLRVDGNAVGTSPVFLRRGTHVVSSADPQVKMGLLTMEPATLPKTKPFPVMWQRRSPTSIEITAGGAPSPFLLVFGDAYHPEWQGTLNGRLLPHVIVNGVSNGWIVPALPQGGTIALTFAGQRLYEIAAIVSLISLVLLAVLALAPSLWVFRPSER